MNYLVNNTSNLQTLHLQISGNLFWGYNIRVNIRDVYECMDKNDMTMTQSLITMIKNDMIEYFDKKGLRDLTKMVKENVFHIHAPIPNENNLDNFANRKVFICNHSQCQCQC